MDSKSPDATPGAPAPAESGDAHDAPYRALQQHLDQLPVGFPAVDSGSDVALLRHIFTPDEARVATCLTWDYVDVPTIQQRAAGAGFARPLEVIEELLENATAKGGLHAKTENGRRYFANAQLLVGMYEMQINRLSKEFFEAFDQYADEAYVQEMVRTGISQFRVVPVEESVTPALHVATYDDMCALVDTLPGPFALTRCICKTKRDLYGEPCRVTDLRETCFVLLPDFAQQFIDQGWGRALTKEEFVAQLRKCEAAGLVLQPGNSQRPGFICSCCGCCCGFLRIFKRLPRPADLLTSNYQAHVDPALCSGCEICVTRCQMDAVTIPEAEVDTASGAATEGDDIAIVDLGRCIGCGVCVPTCPTGAIALAPKKFQSTPPDGWTELYAKIKRTKDRQVKREQRRARRRVAKARAGAYESPS